MNQGKKQLYTPLTRIPEEYNLFNTYVGHRSTKTSVCNVSQNLALWILVRTSFDV